MSQEVYSILLQYLDVTPLDTISNRTYEDQYHWFTRLQKKGDFDYNPNISNYKGVYMLLLTSAFDVDKAFVIACTEGIRDAAIYLSDYATVASRAKCLQVTRDAAITASVPIEEEYIVPVLVSRRDDRDSVELLLRGVVLEQIHGTNDMYSVLLSSPSADIVARHVSDSLMSEIGDRANDKAALVFDSRGYEYPIVHAVRMDLPRSVETWLGYNQTQEHIRTHLITATIGDKQVGRLLLGALQGDKSGLAEFAIRSNNYWVLKELPTTEEHTSLALALGSTNSLRALQSSAGASVTIPRKVRRRRLQ